MKNDFEDKSKYDLEEELAGLESGLTYKTDLGKEKRMHEFFLETVVPKTHDLIIKRANEKLANLEKIEELRARLLELTTDNGQTKEGEPSNAEGKTDSKDENENPADKNADPEPGNNDNENQEGVPEFEWWTKYYTKKKHGIDYKEERGEAALEIQGKYVSVDVVEDKISFVGKKNSNWFTKKFFKKIIKDVYEEKENPVWVVSCYGLTRDEFKDNTKVDEFVKKYHKSEFLTKEEAFSYGIKMRDALLELKKELENEEN